MNDLKNILMMLANSDHSFVKEESGVQCWKITVLNETRIEFSFDKDGKFKSIYAKPKPNV